jgi:phosphonate transport system substrate-binding protein
MGGRLRFGLPRSLGRSVSFERARALAARLDHLGFDTVVPAESYSELEQLLMDGEIHAAWAPPMVCARVEVAGGRIVLRAVRNGSPTYGSALLRDVHYRFELDEVASLPGLRAVWVDRESMAGYILPRHFLRQRGLDPDRVLARQTLLGSYEACLEAVVEGHAELTACFVRGAGEQVHHGYLDILGSRRERFVSVLGLSEQSPHDGIAVSPAAEDHEIAIIVRRLSVLADDPVLAASLDADRFDEPAPGTYRALIDLLSLSTPAP